MGQGFEAPSIRPDVPLDSLTAPAEPAAAGGGEVDSDGKPFGPGLYVHVPFCTHRCGYCDFFVVVGAETARRAFVDDVLCEAEIVRNEGWLDGRRYRSIFLGGGTPSLLEGNEMARLLDGLRRLFPLDEDAEVTVECNPESLTREKARAYQGAGVNRISLGVQAMVEDDLRELDRAHGVDLVRQRVSEVREIGVSQLSLDLIYGLPASDGVNWAQTLDAVFEMEPDHLSAYLLTLEPHVPMARRLVAQGGEVASDEAAAEQYERLQAGAREVGLRQYEISNFARPGFESRHNRNYWVRGEYLGLGPSAHSHAAGRRWANPRSLSSYRKALAEGRSPRDSEETLSRLAMAEEWVFLGLRRVEGISTTLLDGLVDRDAVDRLCARVDAWVERGRMAREGDRVRLTPEAYLVSNALFFDLLDSLS